MPHQPPPTLQGATLRFRLISWNIHKGIGVLDRRYRIERTIQVLQHYEPDILHLQEVTDNVRRSHHHRQADMLGDALDLPHRAYQPNVRVSAGTYGNAILSRFPLFDVRDLELKIPWKKRRRAQIARCRLKLESGETHTLVLVNLHLGLAEYERRIQLRRVVECEALKHVHHDTPLIIAGDMNDVLNRAGRETFQPIGFRNGSGSINTFPAFMPVRALDQIHYRGRLAMSRCIGCPTQVAARASDHLPLIADFELT